MIVVGLSGGIASGKSTVSRLLQGHNVPVVDLDEIAKEVVQPGTSTLKRLAHTFGDDILNADGSLNRAELGRRAFGNKEETKKLNAITHTAIRRVMAWRLVKLWLLGTRLVVVDTPLLIEAGLYKCTDKQQLHRMLQRDGQSKGLTEEDARARLAAQLPLASKLAYADIVIDNSSEADGASELVRTEVTTLVSRWRLEQAEPLHLLSWLLCWLVPPIGLMWGYVVAVAHARRIAYQQAEQRFAEKEEKDV